MRVGIDVIELEKVSIDKKFIKRIATDNEIEYINQYKCENGLRQRVASLWCVKEAVMKALGLGKDSGITMKEIKLHHEESGRPYVSLEGKALTKLKELKLQKI